MNYNFNEIEAKWQKYWEDNQTFKAENVSDKEKFYVLDMFPYPSGAGLHVGHPLGYIASDIYARYKRHKGFNVLHPQGYDSFGLPAEQYAIQTGQHPAITTEANIKTYRRQLDQLGFSFDWSREVRTSDPSYYKWTQWIFIQLFNSWYNTDADKAEDIETLTKIFETEGNKSVHAVCDDDTPIFSAEDWNSFSPKDKQAMLLKYRLTYLAESEVNWCPALGTVLANDEIVNGVSERGGHPVIRKKMTQWSMRITAYAQRLLDGLDKIDWPQPLKDSQTNWIGRSEGASVKFKVQSSKSKVDKIDNSLNTHNSALYIEVFTTRPDTIFGVSFMTLAPEHELVSKITTPEQRDEVQAYIEATAKRSERDRMADVKTITGAFTGAYAEHPFTKEPVPIWIGDYVLAGYGTGAVMSVPCGDQRDYDFATHFGIAIPNIFSPLTPEGGTEDADTLLENGAYAEKSGFVLKNSGFLNGLAYKEATKKAIAELEKIEQGKGKVNYRLRDAVFSRQRYWGEPFPVYYDADGMPQMLDEKFLPLELPEVDKYLPTETGEPPLGNAKKWHWLQYGDEGKVVSKEEFEKAISDTERSRSGEIKGGALELNTMPGWAGSSQYFNRYMDPHNDEAIFSQEAINYWQDVDLYIGGSEHATGHLLYSRFWQKFMFDKGLVPKDEFAKKLINQGMITGTSAFVYRWDYKILENKKAQRLSVFVTEGFVQEMSKKSVFLEDVFENYENLRILITSFHKNDQNKRGFLTISDSPNSLLKIHADVSLVNASDELDIEGFKKWRPEYADAVFILENGEIHDANSPLEGGVRGVFKVSREIEKMSKSKYNVVNPDAICAEYGADSLRLYEMFLGPLEQSKPWNTAGITGVHSFLKKLWRLYHSGPNGEFYVSDAPPSEGQGEALKTLHKTIKKVEEDIENFSFNTSVSTFMICVNELSSQKCNSRAILEPLAILVSPYAPHIAEELWEQLGHTESISKASFPKFEEKYLVESSKEYPISFNGKMRFTLELPMDMTKEEIEATVMAHEKTQQQLQGRTPKKVIVVPGKIVNIVG
ncbi:MULTISPECIES: leucine--tRNA ligase [Maribacter]|uniref:Leucine--tRNA ligase n=1 Tax=Maribacter flavus TaxID=1658664 RepID=A0ABU7IG25_9FLAO|nr:MULTISPECIES: class I tRNA ligase family protein [Maribacter]MDC6404530.1 class I tRNA ligase family protein [Maribacter sp. PR66]MEE1971673.1 class I tRNA ligase family protein [Maribacter flavus]